LKKTRIKSFIGGGIIGFIIGMVAGGFTVACIMGTLFIDYSLHQDKVHQSIISQTK
jgi:hypothetical protein